MKIAVLTFVYPSVEPYFNDFLVSIQGQTQENFELIIVNDGFSRLDLYLNKFSINYTLLSFTGTLVELRKQAILWLKENNYKFVVFADSDDYFDLHRVEIITGLLLNYDIVCNDMVLFGERFSEQKIMGSNRIFDKEEIGIDFLFNANILGMSNTGARVNCITPVIDKIPNDIVAFDWLLYSLALLNGCTCVFTNKTRTYYRQHSNNVALLQNYTDEQIMHGVKVKYEHYRALSNYGRYFQNNAKLFQQLIDNMNDPYFKSIYCQAVRINAPKQALWWEAIKTDQELGI